MGFQKREPWRLLGIKFMSLTKALETKQDPGVISPDPDEVKCHWAGGPGGRTEECGRAMIMWVSREVSGGQHSGPVAGFVSVGWGQAQKDICPHPVWHRKG